MDWMEDGKGNQTTITYDENTHTFPEIVAYPGGTLQSQTTYNPRWGMPDRETGFNGETTLYTYDAFGRPDDIFAPAGQYIDYDYTDTASGLTVKTTYGNGVYHTWQSYNGLGQLTHTVSDGEGGQIEADYQYDTLGRLWKTSVPYQGVSASLWTETTYDALGRTKIILNPDGTGHSFAYSGWQQVIFTDEMTRPTTYTLDGYGRVEKVTQTLDGQAIETAYAYNTLGNLSDVWDAANNHTQLSYDSLGRKLTMSDPDMGQWSYTYNEAGNLETQTDAKNQTITFEYDALNRLTGKDYDGGAPEIRYTYDQDINGKGRRSGMNDLSGSTTWQYDIAGRLESETKTIDSFDHTTGFSYDSLNRLKTMTYPDNEVVTYGYDDAGQVRSLRSGLATYLESASYTPLGQPKTMALGAGGAVNTTFNYYESGSHALALESISAVNRMGHPLLNLDYSAYYPDGSLEDLSGTIGHSAPLDLDIHYVYNSLGWLTGVSSNPDPAYYQLNRSYTYDSIGNLRDKNGLTLADYDQANGGLPHAPGQVIDGPDVIDFTYDANGSRETRQNGSDVLSYTYDIENQLTKIISDSSVLATYTYDGDGNRVKRVAGGEVTHYVGGYYEASVRQTSIITDIEWNFDEGDDGWELQAYDANASITRDNGGYIRVYEPDGMSGTFAAMTKTFTFTIDSVIPGSSSEVRIRRNQTQADFSTHTGVWIKLVGDGGGYYAAIMNPDLPFDEWQTISRSNFPPNSTASRIDYIALNFYPGGSRPNTLSINWFGIYNVELRRQEILTTTKHYHANGQRIATRVDDELYYTLSDHLGSTSLVADEQGNEVGYVLYDPFGGVISSTLPLSVTNHLFTGYRWDDTIGLYDANARFYDPQLGQFAQPDSLIPGVYNPIALNRYAYVYNSPVNYTDPSGHFPCGGLCVLGVTAVVAGGLNVGISGGAAYLSGEEYTWSDAGLDFGIGAVFGALGYGVGARFASPFLRIPSYGVLSMGEGMTSSYFKGQEFTTNDALWAFGTGVAFAGFGHVIGQYFDKRMGELAGRVDIEQQYYARSLRITHNSIRAMRSANLKDAARIARYQREFPNSRLIRALGNYHMSKYIQWNKALYQPPLPRPQSFQKVVASVQGIGAITGAFLADNEYLGLFPTIQLIPNSQMLISGR